jgi:hypothetical protein
MKNPLKISLLIAKLSISQTYMLAGMKILSCKTLIPEEIIVCPADPNMARVTVYESS